MLANLCRAIGDQNFPEDLVREGGERRKRRRKKEEEEEEGGGGQWTAILAVDALGGEERAEVREPDDKVRQNLLLRA